MLFFSTVLVLLYTTAQAQTTCSRTLLQDIASKYIGAQTSGTPNMLPPGPNLTYTENDVPLDAKEGILRQPIMIDLNRTFLDTTSCSVFAEITAALNPHPYVIDTVIRVSNTSGAILSIQSVVADSGDWVFNATSHLRWSRPENWQTVPVSQRSTRSAMIFAADAYLDSWANGSVAVPYGTPCARLEGGAYTGERSPTTNTCHMPEFPKPFKGVGNRRYVVDEEMGAVGILNDFPFIDATRPEGTPSSNLVRIEGGKIRYIHETTICATRGCGR
ncbi:hypothetical protein T440DRAFT_403617 [Plenodomus tracheiphilus IPT5]|uniref:DUF8021 domain-containing protein n=1 Tax=Plenodomus tracheiphilus IPT5 TaxID=1408161 RepID=A0A6A7AZA0_9PLEO|nr:hypothetical protein T440DRAFT_403617 [Plenodomus tracheiphilus IPT5]